MSGRQGEGYELGIKLEFRAPVAYCVTLDILVDLSEP